MPLSTTSMLQATRERLDSLGQVQRALGDARAQHSERMDGLEKMIRTNDAIATAKLMELSETAQREWGLHSFLVA